MDMKKCCHCKEIKKISEFSINNSRKDGHSSTCRGCHRQLRKKHYLKHKESTLKRNNERRQKNKQHIINYKKNSKCIICGETRWWVLDFHHRDYSEKTDEVGNMWINYGIDNIVKEIDKCDIICANCHRDIHYRQNGGIV